MRILVEFGGFYGFHDEIIADQVEMFGYDDDQVNWSATFRNYAEGWLNEFNSEFNFDLKFKGIDSPKYYNFETDKIIAEINDADINFIREDIENADFIEYVNERLASRDGFHSFYDNGTEPPYDTLMDRAEDESDARAHAIELYIEWMIDGEAAKYNVEFEIIENE